MRKSSIEVTIGDTFSLTLIPTLTEMKLKVMGRHNWTLFTICIVALLSCNSINCGLLSNSRIQNFIRAQEAKARTRPPTTPSPSTPKQAIQDKNTTVPNRLADPLNNFEEKRIVLPTCSDPKTYLTDPYKDGCYYLRCDIAHGRYVRSKCPSSTAVPTYFMKRRKGKGKITGYVPCIKPTSNCRPTFSQEGVERPVVISCGIDIVIAVDVSCSITDANKMRIQKFLMSIADVISLGPQSTRIGIVSFSKKIYHVTFLNDTRNKFQYKRSVKLMDLVLEKDRIRRQDCGTSTDLALESVRLDYFTPRGGDRADKPNALFVISDGLTNPEENKDRTIYEANQIKKMKIPTYVMGLPNNRQLELNRQNVYIGDEEWNAIASKPDNVFKMEFDTLLQKIQFLASEVCSVVN